MGAEKLKAMNKHAMRFILFLLDKIQKHNCV